MEYGTIQKFSAFIISFSRICVWMWARNWGTFTLTFGLHYSESKLLFTKQRVHDFAA